MEIGWQNEGYYYFVRTKRYFPSEKTQVSSEENHARCPATDLLYTHLTKKERNGKERNPSSQIQR